MPATVVDPHQDARRERILRRTLGPRKGLTSPDDGDALALTFAYPVANRDWAEERCYEEGLKRLKRWVV